MKKVDFKKELKHLYIPSKKQPSIITIPEMNFIMIDGAGDPNTSGDFQSAVEALYSISYGIKMLPKKGITPEGYFEFVVPPLEGRWDTIDGKEFDYSDKSKLKWTLMIMQPEFVTEELFNQIREDVKLKKDNKDVDKVRFEKFDEGLCGQILHIGPFDDEPATFQILEEYIDKQGYKPIKSGHHEIYLSDPRRSKPENLKTTLRYPIIKK